MFDYEKAKNPSRPYIIAEIGSNHNGDMELAKKMIDSAKECGADCAKFQSWSKDTIFSKKVYDENHFLADDYRNRTDYTLEEIVDEYSIDAKDHIELKKYCDHVGIDFASTPFSKREVDLLVDELNVSFVKVASMDISNEPLLSYIAKKGKPVIISTGLSRMSDICRAIECLEDNGCTQIVILHCVSIYPPDDSQVNLNNIDMLRECFGYPTGYSDHTLGAVAPIISLAKYPCVIEKHFTLDKNMEGWDHKVSADPQDLKQIVEAAHSAFTMLGSHRKVRNENEERRNAFCRSIVAAKPISQGQVITEEDIDFKRPGTGISPRDWRFVVGKTAKRDLSYDEIIQMEDF